MNTKRFAARIIATALASAVLLGGGFAAPAQADTGWGPVKKTERVEPLDTGWGPVKRA